MNLFVEKLERKEPTIAVVIDRSMGHNERERIGQRAHVIEVRADREHYLTARPFHPSLAVLGTARSLEQGGISEKEYRSKYGMGQVAVMARMLAEDTIHAIDVELGSGMVREFADAAHELGKEVVASCHFFEDTPDTTTLEEHYLAAKEQGARYFKVASRVNNPDELDNLMTLAWDHRGDTTTGVIAVGMGRHGRRSRLELPYLGSHMVYTYCGAQPPIEGMISLDEAHRTFSRPEAV